MKKKLYANIKNVDVDLSRLSMAITTIDKFVEELANKTVEIKNTLMTYSGSNQSVQFTKAAEGVRQFSEKLKNMATDLNDFQHDIVQYKEKVMEWEQVYLAGTSPRMLNITSISVPMNSTEKTKFDIDEMRTVSKAISQYASYVMERLNHIKHNVNNIGSYWRDPQYAEVFRPFMEEVCTEVYKNTCNLDDYRIQLDAQIKKIGG